MIIGIDHYAEMASVADLHLRHQTLEQLLKPSLASDGKCLRYVVVLQQISEYMLVVPSFHQQYTFLIVHYRTSIRSRAATARVSSS